MHGSPTTTPPICPTCTRPMQLVRVLPRFAGLPELHSFECQGCRMVLTQAADAAAKD